MNALNARHGDVYLAVDSEATVVGAVLRLENDIRAIIIEDLTTCISRRASGDGLSTVITEILDQIRQAIGGAVSVVRVLEATSQQQYSNSYLDSAIEIEGNREKILRFDRRKLTSLHQ